MKIYVLILLCFYLILDGYGFLNADEAKYSIGYAIMCIALTVAIIFVALSI